MTNEEMKVQTFLAKELQQTFTKSFNFNQNEVKAMECLNGIGTDHPGIMIEFPDSRSFPADDEIRLCVSNVVRKKHTTQISRWHGKCTVYVWLTWMWR